MHTTMYKTHKQHLLYSTENYIQYPVMTLMERNLKWKYVYIYMNKSLFYTPAINIL